MTNYDGNNQPKDSKINQNLLIAVIGAVATLLAAIIPWALNKYESQSLSAATPLVFTATFTTDQSAVPAVQSSVATATLPSTVPSPTAAANAQTGIFNVYLAHDEKGDFRSTSFSPTQDIYLFFSLNDPSGFNIVKTVWIAVDVAGYKPNVTIYKSENKILKSSFAMRTDREIWELGDYKVELYLNGVLDKTVEFKVEN
jgi:hypothetical protein